MHDQPNLGFVDRVVDGALEPAVPERHGAGQHREAEPGGAGFDHHVQVRAHERDAGETRVLVEPCADARSQRRTAPTHDFMAVQAMFELEPWSAREVARARVERPADRAHATDAHILAGRTHETERHVRFAAT